MNAIEDAIYDKLAADATVTGYVSTRIYRSMAPEGAELPYIVYGVQAGGEDNLTPTESASPIYQIRAVSETSAAHAGLIDEAIRDALHNQALTVTGWIHVWTARLNLIRYVEVVSSVVRWHAGAMYRVMVAA